ncbi:MAG: hypothetical protein M3362_21995, partial [Acidobacteriota bacterium]|nr:hypothetical protein [Acidobacteriota bacterium]
MYFSDVSIEDLLGEDTRLAVLPKDYRQVARDFLKWLGVADRPRSVDIIKTARKLKNYPPAGRWREQSRKLFTFLWTQWESLSESERESLLDELPSIAWLPAKNDFAVWYKPQDLFADYQDYLF